MEPVKSLNLYWIVTLRHLSVFSLPEQKPDHMLLNESLVRRVGRIQLVLVDDHDGSFQPLLPGVPGNILIDPFSQFSRIGWFFKAFSISAEEYTFDGSGHVKLPK